ncbi:gag-pol polyprotein, partial [Trifolium medium]|nr:gag-pol polyprotein [Trifolium medium]
MMESINVVIDDVGEGKLTDVEEDDVASDNSINVPVIAKEPEVNSETSNYEILTAPPKKGPSVRVQKNHP